jgi:hypothetical protein
MFRCQLEPVVEYNWAPHENAIHLLAALQGQATEVLCNVPTEAMYEETIRAFEGHYGDHHLATAYHSQLKART